MIINGKQIASFLLEELAQKVAALPRQPGLAFVLVGSHPASLAYVRMKKKACAQVGIASSVITLSEETSENALLEKIEQLNQDRAVDGILVQLPLPPHCDTFKVTRSILPEKDVDGFHPLNLGKLLLGEEGGFYPCTPYGIQILLDRASVAVEGKHVVIVGRSNIVGKPLAAMLMQKKPGCNATVTLAHSRSENLLSITKSADILIAAIGRSAFIKKEMVKKGSVVIDVGINRIEENGVQKIVGDVDFAQVAPLTAAITPVPGGVGPMTIALLMQNTYESACQRSL